MAARTVKKTAKKVTKKVNKVAKTNKVSFEDSFNKIKDTAISVNSQVLDTAGDVLVDLRENGEQIREVAVDRVKKAINNVTETVTDTVNLDNIKSTAKTVNDYTLKTADELVDVALVNGQKWQGVANKAVKGSLKLASKQQDIVFDALEAVKGQFIGGAKRFKKLMQN